MRFVQYYLDCLSQASYLVGDEGPGRAVVVDARRDVEMYLAWVRIEEESARAAGKERGA
jgi:hydroxyacylglutathione hydrolase